MKLMSVNIDVPPSVLVCCSHYWQDDTDQFHYWQPTPKYVRKLCTRECMTFETHYPFRRRVFY